VLLGVDRDRARAETFDPYVVVEVLPQRRAERRSRKALVLVDRQGHETVIVEGAAVPALFPEAQRFFGPRGAEALSLRAPWSVEGWMIKGALAVVAFVVSAWFARASLRASARVRIEVLHSEGIVRIEVFRGARRHVEIALADVASVDVVWSDIVRSDLARVSLMCREGPDVPLLTHPLFGKTVHSSLAAELRHALGVRGEPAS